MWSCPGATWCKCQDEAIQSRMKTVHCWCWWRMSIGVSLVVLISLAFSLAPTSSTTKERDLRLMRSWQRSAKSLHPWVCASCMLCALGRGSLGRKKVRAMEAGTLGYHFGFRKWGILKASRVDGIYTCFFSPYYRSPGRQVIHVCSICIDTSIHMYVNVLVIFRCFFICLIY